MIIDTDINIEKRCRRYLTHAAAAPSGGNRTRDKGLLPLLWNNDRKSANDLIRRLLQECNDHVDCTDFRLNLLLRALCLFPSLIDSEFRESIRETALSARYYGGYSDRYPMFYNSENHHLSWAAAEYLSGCLWPDAVFGFDRRSGDEHRNRAAFLIAHWVNERVRRGFWEWNSVPYMGVNLFSLLNLFDLSPEPQMRRMADDMLCVLLADLAADSAYGGVWAAQARIYQSNIFQPDSTGGSVAFNLLMGIGEPESLKPGIVGDFVATTAWRPPEWIPDMARDLDPPMLNRERHRKKSNVFYKCHSMFWKPPEELWRESRSELWLPEDIHEVGLRTERCGEYIVSAAFTPDEDYFGKDSSQATIWFSCLEGRVPVFVNHPQEKNEKSDRKWYWAGNASIPRCLLFNGTVVALFDNSVYSSPDAADFTHAWFPTDRMDEAFRRDEWFLGRVGKAYAALRACGSGNAEMASRGRWNGREIRIPGPSSAWIGVYGSARADGGFNEFAERVCAMDVYFEAENTVLDIDTGAGTLHAAYSGPFLLNGKEVSISDYPRIENRFCRGEWGSPTLYCNRDGQSDKCLVDVSYTAEIRDTFYSKL